MENNIKRVSEKLDKHRTKLMQEIDGVDHVLECGTLRVYNKLIEFAISNGFETICDIGCAFGHQSELCRDRIEYIGINEGKINFYNALEPFTRYIVQRYPDWFFSIDKEKTLAVSVLALGWNCYKYSEDEFDKQFKALSNDFKASLLYVPIEDKEILKKYFKNVIAVEESRGLVDTAIYYCYNE